MSEVNRYNPQNLEVGDRVVLTGSGWNAEMVGQTVTIAEIDIMGRPRFNFNGDDWRWTADEDRDECDYWEVTRVEREAEPDTSSDFADKVTRHTTHIANMLIEKNAAYGNSALDPVRVFSKASPTEQILIRLDDKLSRLARGHEYPGDDTIDDLLGYLFLYLIARESA